MPITVELIDLTGPLTEAMRRDARRVVRETALRISDRATEKSARDSGAQAVSVYVVTSDASTYDDALAAAQAAYRTKHQQPFPALPEIAAPSDDLEALVAVAAEYGAVNEYERTAFLTPAAEGERGRFEADMERIGGRSS